MGYSSIKAAVTAAQGSIRCYAGPNDACEKLGLYVRNWPWQRKRTKTQFTDGETWRNKLLENVLYVYYTTDHPRNHRGGMVTTQSRHWDQASIGESVAPV